MSQIAPESLKAGLLEVSYPDHLDFFIDMTRELSRGHLSVITDFCPFKLNDLIDVELRPPKIVNPIVFVARIVGLQDLPPKPGAAARRRVSLYFDKLPAPAQAALDDYLKDFRNEKTPTFVRKRKHPRFHVDLPAMVHTSEGDVEGKITDLSQGGAKLISGALLMADQDVSCMFFLPGMKQIFVRAAIQAIAKAEGDNYCYPLKFVSYEANSKLDLSGYLEDLLRKNA